MVVVVVVVVVVGSVAQTVQIGHVVIMVLVRGVQPHIKVTAIDTGLLHARHRNRKPLERQFLEHLRQPPHRRLSPKVKKRRNQHVAGNSRLTIQIERFAAPRVRCLYRHLHAAPLDLKRKRFPPTLPQQMRNTNKHVLR